MEAQTIDEVISQLETIIQNAIKSNSRAGYFAALYHKVTSRVKEGIQAGEFENGTRMEQLDVIFANRYIIAYNQLIDSFLGKLLLKCMTNQRSWFCSTYYWA
jgi:hypothetical protein